VRVMCTGCEATAVCAPDSLPAGWIELDPPPWLAADGPRFACPDDADRFRERSRRQWARFQERTYLVSAAEYEVLRATVRKVASELERLKNSGQRVGNP
jgi:hypothetical protein